jgi:hypothetical protein
VSADELARAVASRWRIGANRAAIEIALQIIAQRSGIGIALRGVGVEGLGENIVEVTSECCTQRSSIDWETG